MLKRTSRFVLEVLPYVLSALIAAVVVPGFLYSQVYGTKASVTPSVPVRSENVFGMIRQGHAAFAPDHSFAKTAGDKQAYR
jgi:hypothetical protein